MKILTPSNKIARTSIYVLIGLSILLYFDNVSDMIFANADVVKILIYSFAQLITIVIAYILWTIPINYMDKNGLLKKGGKFKIFGYIIAILWIVRCLDYMVFTLVA